VETYGPLGFEVVLPDYLPAGLDPDPEVHVITPDALNPAVLVSFSAKDEDDGQLLLVDIISEPLAFIDCPLCPDEGQTSTTVHGGPAVAEEGQFLTGDDSVGYGLTFAVGEVLVQLTADWFVKDPNVTTPTAEMKDELLRIAESMFPSPE
jgi:hypothetical protein